MNTKSKVLFLDLASIESYNRIQRTKTDEAGQKENDGNHDEHNAQGAGHNSAKIEVCCNQGDDGTDDSVRRSHVLFHDFCVFRSGINKPNKKLLTGKWRKQQSISRRFSLD